MKSVNVGLSVLESHDISGSFNNSTSTSFDVSSLSLWKTGDPDTDKQVQMMDDKEFNKTQTSDKYKKAWSLKGKLENLPTELGLSLG